MKQVHKNLWFSLLVFCLLFIYFDNQLSNQFARQTDSQIEGMRQNILVLALEVSMVFYVVLHRPKLQNRLLKVLFVLSVSMVFISYILSFINLSHFTMVLYLTLLLPVSSLLFINSAISRLGISMVVTTLSIIVVLLGIHFFIQYNSTSLYLDADSFVTNASYILLMFLPVVLCNNNKAIKYGTSILIAMAVLFSVKRGGIIALGLSLLMYLLFNGIGIGKRNRIPRLLLSLGVLSVFAYYLFNWIDRSSGFFLTERFMAMEETGGSNRIDIYKETWNMIKTSDFDTFILGHGWNSVLRDSPLNYSAHNDFLEVQYDFGLFVFLIYLFSFVCLFKQLFKMVKTKSKYVGQFACALAIIITLSNVSHIIIYPSSFVIEMIVFSCLVYLDKTYNNENRIISIPIGD